MGTVRAAVMPAPEKAIEVREFPEPQLEPGSALLRVRYSEVCGTDVHLQAGHLAGVPYPLIPGHVSVGVLEKIHGRLQDVHGVSFEEGETVTFLDVHGTCHACWHCLVAKASTRCPHRRVYGITYGAADGLAGGWAEKVHLKAGTHIIRLGEISPRLFMAGGCGLPTALHAVDAAEIQLGETVLVLGAGPVGLAAVCLANLRGAGRVLCVGAPENRLQIARRLGAVGVLDIATADEAERGEWVRAQADERGPDVVIEATGAPAAVRQGLRWVRDAGRVIVVGQYTDAGTIPWNPHLELNRKHVRVQGVWGSDYSHFYRAVGLLRDRRVADAFAAIATTAYGLHEMNQALEAVAAGRSVKALVDPSR